MNRINEELVFHTAFAPESVAASTEKTSEYIDVSGVEEIVFLVSVAPLGANKSLTVTLLASDDSSGSAAEEVETATFTDTVGTAAQTAVVSYRPSALSGRYMAVKFQHDGAAAVICGVIAAANTMYLPAANGWTLAV